MSFDLIEWLVRDLACGYLSRCLHANLCACLFVLIWVHLGRGVSMCCSGRQGVLVWWLGGALLLGVMGVAFVGYVLPWGAMSYWALTVITNLITVVPVVGSLVVELVWGGCWVCDSTLQRFFAVHYIVPLVCLCLAATHVCLLHGSGQSQLCGCQAGPPDAGPFGLVYWKDCLIVACLSAMVGLAIAGGPVDGLHHADNYVRPDRLATPEHIVPEWYFLPFYTALRSASGKGGGVVLLVIGSVHSLGSPAAGPPPCSGGGVGGRQAGELAAGGGALGSLGLLGGMPPAYPFVELAGLATLGYILCTSV